MLNRGVVATLLVLTVVSIREVTLPENTSIYHLKQVGVNIRKELGSPSIFHKDVSGGVVKKTYKKLYSKMWISKIFITRIPLPLFPYKLKKKVMAKVTGYEPSQRSCGKFADGKTSIMENAYELTGVAADPAILPYGTVVYIPSIGYRTVDDTGSAMKKSWRQKKQLHLDVRFLTIKEAMEWGLKYMEVEIYERVDRERKFLSFARAQN